MGTNLNTRSTGVLKPVRTLEGLLFAVAEAALNFFHCTCPSLYPMLPPVGTVFQVRAQMRKDDSVFVNPPPTLS